MKTIERFLRENPSYTKCGNEKISTRTGISVNTVIKFKKTDTYKEIKNTYLNK